MCGSGWLPYALKQQMCAGPAPLFTQPSFQATAQVVSEDLGFKLEKVDASMLGTAKKVAIRCEPDPL